MGNICCERSNHRHQTKHKLYRKDKRILHKTDIECRQLSRAEQYQFFQAIRDQPEEDVISFIKDNPWTLSSTFWFETDRCSCSKDFELGIKENITTTEMMARLELCISTAMCPHVLLKKSGVTVSIDEDVSLDDVSKYQAGVQDLKPVGYSTKLTAGFYWIHLAVFFGKDKLIAEMMSVSCHLTDIVLVSLRHKISPVLIAILHKRKYIVKCLGTIHPSLIWHQSQNLNAEKDNLSPHGNVFDNAFMWTLATHQFEDFLLLWTLAHDCTESAWRTFNWPNVLSMWEDKLHHAIVTENMHHIDCLTKVKGVSMCHYSSLFASLNKSGCSSGFKIILEQTDFCHQFLKRKHGKKSRKLVRNKTYLDQIIAREAFHGNEETAKLLIGHGFDVNAKLASVSLCTWTEALNEIRITKLLVKAGARTKTHMAEHSLIHTALDLNHHIFNEMDTLYVVHKLYENGFHLFESENSILKAYRRFQYCICKYMLLREEDPIEMLTGNYRPFIWRFLYLIITSNSCVTFREVIRKGSFVFSLYEPFELLSILPEIANKSSIEDLVSSESMEWIDTHIIPRAPKDTRIQWYSCVRSLQSLCRSALSTHFKGFKYLRYLKFIEEQIPKQIYKYLQKDDVTQLISKHLETLGRYESELKSVEAFFL